MKNKKRWTHRLESEKKNDGKEKARTKGESGEIVQRRVNKVLNFRSSFRVSPLLAPPLSA